LLFSTDLVYLWHNVRAALLYTFTVCDDDPTQEQPGPDPSGATPDPTPAPISQQLLFNVQSHFSWINGIPEIQWIFGSLAQCNIYGILSSALGPANNVGSYNLITSSVVGSCNFGGWTPTSNGITNFTPQCNGANPCNVYLVDTFHSGNINVDIEANVSAVATGGVTLKITQSHGGALQWMRQSQ
jgi:hypothetical protein